MKVTKEQLYNAIVSSKCTKAEKYPNKTVYTFEITTIDNLWNAKLMKYLKPKES